MIETLRTTEERFENLPNFSFSPNYIDSLSGYEKFRLHYIDEGNQDSDEIFLCLHGQPTWSYLYRKMIPVFTKKGYRVIAPDFYGFGRSDKPVDDEIYTFSFHRGSLIAFIEYFDLSNITLVCQDWGGILGLTLPMEMPDKFSRLIIMNTAIAAGDIPMPKGFIQWREWNRTQPDLDVGRLLGRSCPHLSVEELAAYDAPFPDVNYKAGVRRFPDIVPDNPDADGAKISLRAREWLQNKWSGQSFMAIGMTDPVLGPPVMRYLRQFINGCPKPYEIKEAGHFVQEWGENVAIEALKTFELD